MGRSLVALAPGGLTHTRRCRGGCSGAGPRASDTCVWEHPDIRLFRLFDFDSAQTRAWSAAAVELLWMGERFTLSGQIEREVLRLRNTGY